MTYIEDIEYIYKLNFFLHLHTLISKLLPVPVTAATVENVILKKKFVFTQFC